MQAKFYVDEYGFVRRNWRQERAARQQNCQQAGFLQVVKNVASGFWKAVRQTVTRTAYKNSKDESQNIQPVEPRSERVKCADRVTTDGIKRPAGRPEDALLSESNSSTPTIKIAPCPSPPKFKRVLSREIGMVDLQQPEQSVYKFFKEQDIYYRKTSLSSIDVYHIYVDRSGRQTYDSRFQPIAFDANFSFSEAHDEITSAIDEKEKLIAYNIQQTNQQLTQELKHTAQRAHIPVSQQAPIIVRSDPPASASIPIQRETFDISSALPSQAQLLQIRPEQQPLKSLIGQSAQQTPTFFSSPPSHALFEANIFTNPFACSSNPAPQARKAAHRSSTSTGRSRKHVERPE